MKTPTPTPAPLSLPPPPNIEVGTPPPPPVAELSPPQEVQLQLLLNEAMLLPEVSVDDAAVVINYVSSVQLIGFQFRLVNATDGTSIPLSGIASSGDALDAGFQVVPNLDNGFILGSGIFNVMPAGLNPTVQRRLFWQLRN